jgi:hypothetical protein
MGYEEGRRRRIPDDEKKSAGEKHPSCGVHKTQTKDKQFVFPVFRIGAPIRSQSRNCLPAK